MSTSLCSWVVFFLVLPSEKPNSLHQNTNWSPPQYHPRWASGESPQPDQRTVSSTLSRATLPITGLEDFRERQATLPAVGSLSACCRVTLQRRFWRVTGNGRRRPGCWNSLPAWQSACLLFAHLSVDFLEACLHHACDSLS